ncbi:cardiolipin synthase [Haloferula rosea]|uniref:Cardiolipin synthase n=1 Tax=Haloferula rosea TaxID=490093 RepID=A0A934VGU6_9BACT|nr:cardiolipin synthase [Haloferula rosea]MBK1828407.1 cardiolipin synthase [Haloferula rosea]
MNPWEWIPGLTAIGLLCLHVAGLAHVIHVIMHGRTAQGTIAWIVCMVVAPWVAIPSYWVFGRKKFTGYVHARRKEDQELERLSSGMKERLKHYEFKPAGVFSRAAELLGGLPFTRGNEAEILVDGNLTFESIFRSMASAKHYILVNFFIVKNDRVGTKFKEALIERATAGVKVYFLFDEVGSHKLPSSYLEDLRNAGVICHSFGVNRRWWSRLQINFRNHRKIVVVDGEEAFIGGLNVGDEYLGRDLKFGAWRDTHLRLRGPSVQAIQLVFLEDWNWAADEIPPLSWNGSVETADQTIAIIPTGPADIGDSWQLVVAEACNNARDRLWIASPYFVPDQGVLTALQAAAIRGVDVRILIPEKADHLMVWLAAFSFYQEVIPYGVKLMRYHRGFLHQKVMLIDDSYAFIGTGNLDNRSFRLNFEISAVSTDPGFIDEVTHMLELDFNHAREAALTDLDDRSFGFRLACRTARLFAPIL